MAIPLPKLPGKLTFTEASTILNLTRGGVDHVVFSMGEFMSVCFVPGPHGVIYLLDEDEVRARAESHAPVRSTVTRATVPRLGGVLGVPEVAAELGISRQGVAYLLRVGQFARAWRLERPTVYLIDEAEVRARKLTRSSTLPG